MKPCCSNPRLVPLGISPTDVAGLSAIAWWTCRACKAQASEFIAPDRARPPSPPVMKQTDEPAMQRCCDREMTWDGIESVSTGTVSRSENKWHCASCRRTLRVPRGAK